MTTPDYPLNPFIHAVEAPPIPVAQGWKTRYDGHAGPMIDLSQAVPGTPPPPALMERLAAAAGQTDTTRYGAILGDNLLREAHAAAVAKLYGGKLSSENVAITSGCNQAFVVTMMALARSGDAVLLPAPWYFNHKMTLDMLGIEARLLPCHSRNGFVPDVDEAENLLADGRVRAIVLVTPNNPTGAVYPPDVLADFAALARRHHLPLVLDETYRDFLPLNVPRAHNLFLDEGWNGTLIQLYSFSKAYALPGHRLGAVVAAPRMIAALEKILDSIQICPARTAQPVVVWAMDGLAAWREEQRAELARRAEACRVAFATLKGWRLDSIGAYFAFAAHPFGGTKAVDVAETLALKHGVLTLPGSYFGPAQETHLRIAFANVGVEALTMMAKRLKTI